MLFVVCGDLRPCQSEAAKVSAFNGSVNDGVDVPKELSTEDLIDLFQSVFGVSFGVCPGVCVTPAS
jgi:hypothetical protein